MSTSSTPLTLDTSAPEHPSLDYSFLRKEGLRHIARLAGHLWTDYNTHDPGVTILEQLCYALTDLAYRVSHPIADHLVEDGEDAYPSLYRPRAILSCEPVTLQDLRKLVLDVDGVRNAWVQQVREQQPAIYYDEARKQLDLRADNPSGEQVRLKGLYRVIIEKSEVSWHFGSTVERAVAERLHAHRGLCEDFEEVTVLDPVDVRVHAALEVGDIDDADTTLFLVYRAISEYLSPTVEFSTLQQMLEAGYRLEEILDGPQLEHGFIRDDELAELARRQQLHASDLIHVILDVPGVRAVRHISISMGDGTPEPWSLDIGAGRVARLVLTKHGSSELTIEAARDRIALGLHEQKVQETYTAWLTNRARKQPLHAEHLDLEPTRGRTRDVANYHAVQLQLPACYGIGELGLAPSASPKRKLQAKQLQGYLTFYDQLLADYFAQLAHVKDLYSYHQASEQTYFCQGLCPKTLGIEDLWRDGPVTEEQLHELLVAATSPGQLAERKGRFLNHLLARFGEEFTEYSLVLYGALKVGGEQPDSGQVRSRLNRDKLAFLRAYPQISSRRGCGFNYLQSRSELNCSGLEQRVALRLGFEREAQEECLVVEHLLLRPMTEDRYQLSEDEFGRLPLLAATERKDPYSLQLSVVLPAWPQRFQAPAFRELTEQTIRAETPAHLAVYVHWLAQPDWDAFVAAHERWLTIRRMSWQG